MCKIERFFKNDCKRPVSNLIFRLVSTERFSLNARYEAIASATLIFGSAAFTPASISIIFCAATDHVRVFKLFGLTSVPSWSVPVTHTGHFTLPGQLEFDFDVREHRFSCRR